MKTFLSALFAVMLVPLVWAQAPLAIQRNSFTTTMPGATINAQGGSITNFSTLAGGGSNASVLYLTDGTHIVGGFSNGVWFGSATFSNLVVNGSFVMTNASTNVFLYMITSTNPPQGTTPFGQSPMFAENIPGGNTGYIDTLSIGCPYDYPNNYADITGGFFHNGTPGSGQLGFIQEFAFGMCSTNGNWATNGSYSLAYPSQLQYGVYGGSNFPAIVLELNNGNPFVVASDNVNGIVPAFFLSHNATDFMVTDQSTGSTNYFDFNKITGSFQMLYGTNVAPWFEVTSNGQIFFDLVGSIYSNPLHGGANHPELQINANESISFNAGQNNQHAATVQLGTSLATHEWWKMQYDFVPTSATNYDANGLWGYSKPLGFSLAYGNGTTIQNPNMAFRAEAYTNTDIASLRFYSEFGKPTGWNQLTLNSQSGYSPGGFNSNQIFWTSGHFSNALFLDTTASIVLGTVSTGNTNISIGQRSANTFTAYNYSGGSLVPVIEYGAQNGGSGTLRDINSGSTRVDWANQTLQTGAGVTVDWANRLLMGNWTCPNNFTATNIIATGGSIAGFFQAPAFLANSGTYGWTNGQYITIGTNMPNGAMTGVPGCLYLNASGGSGQTLWAKETGVNTTGGWVPYGNPKMTANTTSTATFNTVGYSETIYDSSGSTITSLTITLPATTVAGEICRYVTAAVATTVTVNGTVAIGAAVTSLAANSSIAYQAADNAGTFIRIQ